MFGSGKDDVTGSITPPPGRQSRSTICRRPPIWSMPGRRQRSAHAAAARTPACRGKIPHTGARGTVTPIASAYTDGGQTCHDFLASYVQGSSQAWLQGEACKPRKGAWEVRTHEALEAVVRSAVAPEASGNDGTSLHKRHRNPTLARFAG